MTKQNKATRSPSIVHDPNSKLAELVLALRTRETREHRGLCFIEGIRFVLSAERAGTPFHSVIISTKLLKSSAGKKCVERLRERDVPIHLVSANLFRQLSTAKRACGLSAIIETSIQRIESHEFCAPHRRGVSAPLWIGARHLNSAGNLGTLLRTAEAVTASGVICFGNTRDPYDPASIRASMGALFHLDIVRTTHGALRRWRAKFPDLAILGASVQGSLPCWEADLTRPTILMLGNERSGLTEEEEAMCDALVSIPMGGAISSLNAGVAASVMLYEAWRQRSS